MSNMSVYKVYKRKNKKKYLVGLALLFGLLVGFSSIFNLPVFSLSSLSAIYANVLADLANKDRNLESISQLAVSESLTKAAQAKADDMAEKSYFAHISPEGRTPWYWMDKVGYEYAYAGENLAINFDESADVDAAWMNSPAHRANIVNTKFTEIGIATAEGFYEGRPTTFVVQMFGTPLAKIVSANSQTNIVTKKEIAASPEPASGGQSASPTTVLGENTSNMITTQNPLVPQPISLWSRIWSFFF